MQTDLPPNLHPSILQRLVAFWRRWNRARARSAAAEGLNDRVLADIGLPRCLLIVGVP
jgi:uncharacterized protein YjiS (DUF1127 family)